MIFYFSTNLQKNHINSSNIASSGCFYEGKASVLRNVNTFVPCKQENIAKNIWRF